MKNSLKYFGLWQKKRSELRIDDDPQTDWQQMQALLDQHLPVEEGKPSRSKGFKLMSVLFVSMSAAAMTYVVSNVVEIKKHKHDHIFGYHHKNHKMILDIDSISKDSAANSLAYNTTAGNKDSVSTSQSSTAKQSAGMANSTITKNSAIVSAKSAGATSLATTASRSNTRVGINDKGPATPVKKNSLATIGSMHNGRRTTSNTNSKLFSAFNKNSAPKFGSLHRSGGRYAKMHGTVSNNSSLLSGSSNRYANHIITNRTNKQDDSAGKVIGKIDNANIQQYPALLSLAPMPGTDQQAIGNIIRPIPITMSAVNALKKSIPGMQIRSSRPGKPAKSPKTKSTTNKNSTPSNIDWGLLTGVNSSGSFTPKSQNSNFYGSSPVDLYFGLYGTYNLNDNWAINMQLRLFSPQIITTTYSHANGSKVDSGQLVQVVNSAKFYSISVPIRAMYKINSNISLVGGSVINIPVKMLNIKSSLLPAGLKADSNYYNKTISLLNGTAYQQSLNFGITGGVNFQFNRLSFEASLLHSLSGYQVTSGYGSGRSYNNTFQFTIGFRLNKARP